MDYYDEPAEGLITLDNYDEWYSKITNNETVGPPIDECDINKILGDVSFIFLLRMIQIVIQPVAFLLGRRNKGLASLSLCSPRESSTCQAVLSGL